VARRDIAVLKWAIIFLVISLVAGALGFSNVSSLAGRLAKILFAIFFILFLIVLVFSFMAGEFLLSH
jgi:uncharacterized membrane protein YtjA (UPF0391 family)